MKNYSLQIVSSFEGVKPLRVYTILVLIVMSMASVARAQLPARTITTDAENAQQVYAIDLNGDSYPDVLSASAGDNKIAWYENKIGQGGDDDGFGRQQIITTDAAAAQSIHAGDLNGNGRPDILSASTGDNKIAWYENQTGEGDGFSDQKLISTDAEGATSVYMEDLTGDGNADVLSASADDNTIAWYENQIAEGKGFSDQRVITTDAQGATSVTTEDLNDDGNPDVISASAGDNKIAWYRNQAGQGFSDQKVITTNANDVQSVDTAPLGHRYPDSSPDVVFAETEKVEKCVNPLQNNDYESWSCRTLSTDGGNFQSVHTSDIVGGSGLEILHTSSDNGNIGYGQLTNIAKEINNPLSVYTSDINRDGDRDVICASSGGDMIAWFENNFDGPNGAWIYNFSVSFSRQNAEIKWKTGWQFVNAGFRIQRRTESSGWETLGFIEGAGSTNQSQMYRFSDSEIPFEADTLSYRLQQEDTDGKVHSMRPATATVEPPEKVKLRDPYPNPTTSEVTVGIANKEGQSNTRLALYDIIGRRVKVISASVEAERKEISVDVSGLSSGMYFLRLTTGSEQLTRRIVVVE